MRSSTGRIVGHVERMDSIGLTVKAEGEGELQGARDVICDDDAISAWLSPHVVKGNAQFPSDAGPTV